MKIGMVLEGGAMRGIYTAGVIDTFLNYGIQVDGIMGVSAGALFGVNYKSRQLGRAIRYNRKYLRDKNYMGFSSFIRTGNIMNEEFCFHKLVNELDPFDYDTYKSSKEDFYVVVTNIETGAAEYILIDNFDHPMNMEYLRATGSMPFVSKPVVIDHKKYLDGALADSIPVRKMKELGYDKLIVILTKPYGYQKKKKSLIISKLYYKKYPHLIEDIQNRYQVYNQQLHEINEMEEKGEIFVIRPSKMVSMSRLEKNLAKVESMYQLGVNDSLERIETLKEYLQK